MKRERNPTKEEFKKLLLWLNPDPDHYGADYTLIQARLIRIFISRGCGDSEMLAVEVLNRVAVRIDTLIPKYNDPLRCCIGFVDNVCHEYFREIELRTKAKEPPKPRPAEELEREDGCLKECLDELRPGDRDIVIRYFEGEKSARIAGRKKLAEELHLTANALRIQAHRHRQKLRQCLQLCLERI